MKPLPQNYDHKITEKKWQEEWEKLGLYQWKDDQSREETFVIDTPPPTVSGVLHMGHIFSYTQADFVARYMRMRGKDVFYPMGFDDNGLPTERLVEKTQKIRATDMSREDFIKRCEAVSEEARKEFRYLFESVALSVDWRQEYHTISAECRKISQLSFLDLHNKDRAYRKLQPMLWDPVDQTAIAQAEVEDKEVASHANYIPFGIVDADTDPSTISWDTIEKVNIMTTRPELLGACVALMCHPDDAAKYKGKKAVTPLFNVLVDIKSDAKVDKEKGTGLVMCCTFGDETDILWWRTHDLPTRVMLNKYGKIDIPFAGEKISFSGIGSDGDIDSTNCVDIKKVIAVFSEIHGKKVSNIDPKSLGAREITINLLKDAGLLIKQEPITHAVKSAERSGAPLEILPTYQWFIKILDQKEELKAKAAECNWHPEYMRIRMNQWIDGLSWDWCISRQRYFGVPFPVWYARYSNESEWKTILPLADQLPINPISDLPFGLLKVTDGSRIYDEENIPTDILSQIKSENLRMCYAVEDIYDIHGILIFKSDPNCKKIIQIIAEADVMDTWATSSISPQLSSKGISKELSLDSNRHTKLFPADLRPQAHEIIRTWAFYTIVKAHLHENTIPWKNLMISGWCLASDKSKMSKSKGNVITPVGLIEEKGADVVRFWASTSRLGADTAFSEDVLKIGRKLVTKLWNATKFAAIHLDKIQQKPGTALEDVNNGTITEPLDLWILTRLKLAIKKATQEFDKYEYCDARVATEDFFWNDFCDNYLELVKGRVYGENESASKVAQKSAVYTIYHCLDGILRLFAPIVPHITDELYTHIFDDKGCSVHARGNWPNAADYPEKLDEMNAGIAAVGILNAVRKLKADRNVSIKWPLNFISITINGDSEKSVLEQIKPFAEDLRNVTSAEQVIFISKTAQDGQGLSTITEDGKFEVTAEFGVEASNSAVA